MLGTPGLTKTWTPATSTIDEVVDGPTYGIGLVSRLPVRSGGSAASRPPRSACRCSSPRSPGHGWCPSRTSRGSRSPPSSKGRPGRSPWSTTHLSFVPGYNVRQLRTLTRWVARMPGPVFLLGDLNLPGALPAPGDRMAPARAGADVPGRSGRACSSTTCSRTGWTARCEAQALPLPVSDHCALGVDVDLCPATSGEQRRQLVGVGRSSGRTTRPVAT